MKLIFERSVPGRRAIEFLDAPSFADVPLDIPEAYVRKAPPELPEVSELEVVRHYTALSQRNFGVDTGFYPLGSCTMKYNPRILEVVASFEGFRDLHPNAPEELVQGALAVLAGLERNLREILGMDAVSLLPAAGSHGELLGLMLVRAYFAERGEQRDVVLVPDSAHGTNPASAAMAGFRAVTLPSNSRGRLDLEALRRALAEHEGRVAALMLTNPNTLGLFEDQILEIAERVHEAGALLYMDGANLNALLGVARPGDMGFDIVHVNVHKTLGTPHGGGGPGAGPVGVKGFLADYLPVPRVVRDGERFTLVEEAPKSVGRIRSFAGSFGVLVKAYAYILLHGPEGLRRVAERAVLNANYLFSLLKDTFAAPYPGPVMHEFVLSGKNVKAETGVRTLDVAKRLLDYGFHPPTIYFPLIVEEALMIEPTETEAKETLDAFAAALRAIVDEARRDPERVRSAPHTTPVGRLDDVKAARRPVLRYRTPERAQ
ncbi:aminomethyl-transferring glycine dehydrogenase subunit GcvPB [Brockia lithotrophica]|uniref:Probable glycine dehydrogenase (decarboxylating) subunit 2 n=1 Tax=Brockia lithotrophica TaxID=933949 RepID=A0A660LAY2_9BACL|nr:aminomethyl-transferring glycine dehydrogenase subunit GcvPB [Brockia lithotrophica]RKQ88760.1 glycine cleavage system protein P-like pyridoxal-binding family [Brockia lithotrophica]